MRRQLGGVSYVEDRQGDNSVQTSSFWTVADTWSPRKRAGAESR
jgi:hypothetical protein